MNERISIGALISKNNDNYIINNFMLVNMFEDNMAEVLTGDEAGALYPACYGPSNKYSNFILPEVTSYILNTDEIDIGDGVFVFETIANLFEKCLGLEFKFDSSEKKFEIINMVEEDEPLYATVEMEDEDYFIEAEDVDINDMKSSIKEKVVAQDEAVNRLCNLILYNQMFFSDDEDLKLVPCSKKTILLSGKIGTGKKEIIKQISNYLNVPLLKLDSFSFNEDRYSQRGAFGIYGDLLVKTNYDIDKAEHGIILIDEINKILEQDDVRDVYKEFIQRNIVDFLDYNDKVQGSVSVGTQIEGFNFDVSKVTKILIGDFDKVEEKKNKSVGFEKEKDGEKSDFCSYLIDLGFDKSLVCRIDAHVKTKDLLPKDLEKISKESSISPLILKKYFYGKQGIDLVFNDEFIKDLAEEAYATGMGAKGIQISFENVCENLEKNFLDKDLEFSSEDVEKIEFKNGKIRKIGVKNHAK